jgi:phosphoserine aminotransferase
MMPRVHNFCAGPCTLPLSVLEQVQAEFLDFASTGMSLIELSHRSPEYDQVHRQTIDRFRAVFGVPEDRAVLLLQGGATLQFSMAPMNLAQPGELAGYVRSGSWGVAAERDAAMYADVYPAWDGEPFSYRRMPDQAELEIRPATRYLHVTSNETIEGIRLPSFPNLDVPLVVDASSDYLSRPIPWDLIDLVYGGVQKNLGPAGLAVVVIRRELLEQTNRNLGSYLRYDRHAEQDSLLNTPPMFAIYLMSEVLAWMQELGGVEGMQERAERRSGQVYGAIDQSGGFYRSPVDPRHRSLMNIVFRLSSEDLEQRFLKEAEAEGLVNLKGHRSVGGVRASIYNAMTDDGVEALVAHMRAFRDANA